MNFSPKILKTFVFRTMDIVDIDKVLDDFELNEDNGYNCNNVHHNNRIGDTIQVDKLTAPISQQNNPKQSSSTVSNKQFVNVSNVFHSLNEYVNAEVESKLPQYVEEKSDDNGVTSEVLPKVSFSQIVSLNTPYHV